MIAVMKIVDYSAKDALAVPINLVQNSEEGNYVMVAETKGSESVARRKMVKTGKTGTDRVEILEGLQSGDRLISVGYQELNEGDLLQVK
jgi:multidrug efflux pump subunit AcrA (membrane-fusion protein)